MPRFTPKASSVLEKKIFNDFYHIWAWRPSWSTNRDHFSNLSFPQSKEAPYEIWAKLAQRLQRKSCLKFWTFFPYKCIRKQNWPYHKMVKCQCTTIILATLVDLLFPMTYAKIHPKASSVLEKKSFKGFYHIWAWRPSWSMDRNHFSNFSFPQPKEAPYEIWAKLAQGLQRRSRLKMLTDGHMDGQTDGQTHGRMTDEKWSQ